MELVYYIILMEMDTTGQLVVEVEFREQEQQLVTEESAAVVEAVLLVQLQLAQVVELLRMLVVMVLRLVMVVMVELTQAQAVVVKL